MSDISTPSFDALPVPSVEELASFDPQSSPSPVVAGDSVRITAEPSFAMLSPEMKARVTDKLTSVPAARHDEMMPSLIMDELRQHSLALRVKMGLKAAATASAAKRYSLSRTSMPDPRDTTDCDLSAALASARLAPPVPDNAAVISL
ncbi:hypothetical protein [Sphingomonas rubra]|uniref:Uncharacterized protein n=1 Tax=Sphingomonas rubra TaxID=634430 RepID=A0A1I5R9Q2_9SPHN|nr:hypothetical protein [Sphingomonas rubra]SFP55175.1 hypothetical protein SAMN04488241_10399 [Sphingomonas rubra]